MQISTVLDHIDSGHMALPEFQRGYVWNRNQVRDLMQSLYRRHPVGSLLVWVTESEGAEYRGDGAIAPGVVKLLLDGQQRMTSLYGIIRGREPRFFDGSARSFTGLYFDLETEEFSFYKPTIMKGDLRWVNVTLLMKQGNDALGALVTKLSADAELTSKVGVYAGRLSSLLGIRDVKLHVEEVTGKDKTVDVVVDIFNRVNSGGKKLSQGDLALAKVCADWPEARDKMKEAISRWNGAGYNFNLDWLLRVVNTVLTGEAKFNAMHNVTAPQVQDGLKRAERAIDYLLNAIAGRLGLDHDRVFFGRYGLTVMAHYLDRKGGQLDGGERDKLLYWHMQSAMFGRFSGSTESYINQDLELIADLDGALDRLIDQLRLWRGSLSVESGHFTGWGVGARFYPVLYLLTRVCGSRDWGNGLALASHLLGRMNQLEVHHIFPKSRLYKHRPLKLDKSQVNAVANFCFLTKDTNLEISNRLPEAYFPEIEERFPGALASQWIPLAPELWKIDNYLDFLEARNTLLAKAMNEFLDELRSGAGPDLPETVPSTDAVPALAVAAGVPGSIDTDEEEQQLLDCAQWVQDQGLPEGELMYEATNPDTGELLANFDLAWPEGLQTGLSQPVAVLLNEGSETLEVANALGYRYFTDVENFHVYVNSEILAGDNN